MPPSMVPRMQRSQSAREPYRGQRAKAHSAPVALQLSAIGEEREGDDKQTSELYTSEFETMTNLCMCLSLPLSNWSPPSPVILHPGAHPYSAFSPESQDSVHQAVEAISKSQEIRRELRQVIDQNKVSQTTAHDTVNDGLTRKLAETVTLTV